MSAQLIYDLASLGAIIRFSDGTPRPPERHRKKLAAWEHRNSGGRLIRREPGRCVGNTVIGATITLHAGDYGGGGVVVLRLHRTFSVDSDLSFVVTERSRVGAVRVLSRPGEDAELVYLASSRADAECWLQSHGYPDAVLDEVTADGPAADVMEGWTAA